MRHGLYREFFRSALANNHWKPTNVDTFGLLEEAGRQRPITMSPSSSPTCNLPSPMRAGTKRVLIACSHFWPSIGGLENQIEQLSAALVKEGYSVTIMTPVFPGRESDIHNGVQIRSIDPANVINGVHEWPYAVRTALISCEYDACILMQDPLGNIIWSVEGVIPPLGTRLIIQPIINADGYGKWKNNVEFNSRLASILKNASKAIAMTKSGPETQFMRTSGIVPAYIPNATRVPPSAGDFRKRYGIDEKRFLILHVANLFLVKNHIGLLDTLNDLPTSWQLVMVGKPSGEPECARAVLENLSRRPDVLYIPGLSREWVSAAMEAADVIVLSSFGEGSPNTILEAMAHGKPWLATPECGAANDNSGGIICRLQDFKKHLAVLHENPGLNALLGEYGYQHWRECFSWDVVIKGWIDIIESGDTLRSFTLREDIHSRNRALVERIKRIAKRAEVSEIANGPGQAEPEYGNLTMRSEHLDLKACVRTPLVSLIVPTYNRPDMLEKALKSIMAQGYRDFEIIVVNDAGINVAEIITRNNRDNRIVYVQNDRNLGRSASRNIALKMARGKYIGYLDDDDVLYPHHLETLVSFLEHSRYKVAYTDAHRIHQAKVNDTYTEVGRDKPYSFHFDRHALLTTNYIPILCIMHERSCIEDAGLFDENLNVLEDWDLWIRMSLKYEFAHIRQVTAAFTWRIDGSSTTSSPDYRPEWSRCREIILNKYRDIRSLPSHSSLRIERIPCNTPTPSTNSHPLISIIILSLNQVEWTLACLHSIQKYTSLPYEVVLVDNGSSGETTCVLKDLMHNYRKAPRVTVIFNDRNNGFAGGNNQGMVLARGQYVLLLNNDTLVTEGWLERLMRLFTAYPRTGIVGPMSNYVSGPQAVAEARYSDIVEMEAFANRWREAHRDETFSLPAVIGFCMLIRRSVIEAIGGLDPLFGIGNFEDVDYCYRASLSGFEIRVAKDVFIHHQGSLTFKSENLDHPRSMKKNWELFKAKWGLGPELRMGQGNIVLSKANALRQFIALPHLQTTHECDAEGRCWFDKSRDLWPSGNGIGKDYRPAENRQRC